MVISYQAYWFFISDINFFSDIPMLWVIPLYWIIHPMACLVSFTFWSTPVLSSSSFFTLTITRWSSFQRWSDSVMINWSTQHQAHSCPDYLPIPVSLAHITYHYHQHYWYISYHPCSPYPPILVTGIAPLCHALPSVRQSQSTRRGGEVKVSQTVYTAIHCTWYSVPPACWSTSSSIRVGKTYFVAAFSCRVAHVVVVTEVGVAEQYRGVDRNDYNSKWPLFFYFDCFGFGTCLCSMQTSADDVLTSCWGFIVRYIVITV